MHSSPSKKAMSAHLNVAELALAMATIVAFPSSGHAAVFGTDTRARLIASDAGMRTQIGTLSSSETGAFCTAFCVADDLIATASHCVFGTAASPGPKLTSLSFKPASAASSDDGTPLAGKATNNQLQNVTSGTTHLAVVPPIGAANDWAVARLETPACWAGHLPVGSQSASLVRAQALQGGVYQIAVHADLPDNELRRGAPCAFETEFPKADVATIARDFALPTTILFHTCDTGGGSSGSPLLIDTPAGPEVVGINVGTYILSRAVATIGNAHEAPTSEAIANTAIEVVALRDAISVMENRDLLNSISEVRSLQTVLAQKHLFRGPRNGHVDRELIAAIVQFETLNGQPSTGLVRRSLLDAVAAWQGVTPQAPAPLTPMSTMPARR
jgi:V8-like Glu-specific endopeptidase